MRFIYSFLFFFALSTSAFGDSTNYITQDENNLIESHQRGLIKSSRKVEIRTDLIANVLQAPFQEGMQFKKGDILIAFDCMRYQAELDSAKAIALSAEIDLRNKEKLFQHQAAGKSELEIAKAVLSRAQADIALRKAMMKDCKITAPFSGRVVNLSARKHEMPTANQPIITIIDDANLELELVIPSHWLTWLRVGEGFSFQIDETGLAYNATIERLGAEVDPVSQTIKAFGKLHGQYKEVLAGMSGAATFNTNP